MTGALRQVGQAPADSAELAEFAAAVADDMELLADLHDREPSQAVLQALVECSLEQGLAVSVASAEGAAALEFLRGAIDALPSPVDASTLDELAAGYADVYLRHGYRAAPTESVWLTEDGLERQGPMLDLRAYYRRHGLRSTDWASRPEDHIVVQLRFGARLLRNSSGREGLDEVTRFLDAHMMRWVRRFAGQLVGKGAPDFYAGLALVTATYLDEVRGHLAAITGIEVPVPVVEVPKAVAAEASAEDRPYVPGIAPSW